MRIGHTGSMYHPTHKYISDRSDGIIIIESIASEGRNFNLMTVIASTAWGCCLFDVLADGMRVDIVLYSVDVYVYTACETVKMRAGRDIDRMHWHAPRHLSFITTQSLFASSSFAQCLSSHQQHLMSTLTRHRWAQCMKWMGFGVGMRERESERGRERERE